MRIQLYLQETYYDDNNMDVWWMCCEDGKWVEYLSVMLIGGLTD